MKTTERLYKAPPRIKAWDWFNITGRGIVVSVDVPGSNNIRPGDAVQFDLAPNSPGRDGLIKAGVTYRVYGVEESRCLVDHGPGSRQCCTGRGLAVREMEQR